MAQGSLHPYRRSGRLTILCCLLPSALGLAATSAPSPPPDIHDIVAPQPYYIAGSYWLLLLAVVCLLAAAGVGWMLFSFRDRNVKILPTPRELAGKRLEALLSRLDETDARTFGAEAADILRVFIGAQHRLHAVRQTSPEFLESIWGWPYFSAVQHSILEEFLTQCDLLKFARLDATYNAKLRLVDQAAQFLAAESPTLPAGAPAVSRSAVSTPASPNLLPPPLPGALQGPGSPDARYMPPGSRQTTLPTPETAASSAEP